MTTVQTYQGIVRQEHIRLKSTDNLPEGSQVYVFLADDQSPPALLDAHIARRKANGWLVTNVGSVIAQQPHLLLSGRAVTLFPWPQPHLMDKTRFHKTDFPLSNCSISQSLSLQSPCGTISL